MIAFGYAYAKDGRVIVRETMRHVRSRREPVSENDRWRLELDNDRLMRDRVMWWGDLKK